MLALNSRHKIAYWSTYLQRNDFECGKNFREIPNSNDVEVTVDELLKVNESQKHFFLKLYLPKTEINYIYSGVNFSYFIRNNY